MFTVVPVEGATAIEIKNGATVLTKTTDYTIVGNTVTIKKEYLATLPKGDVVLAIVMSKASSLNVSITINETI